MISHLTESCYSYYLNYNHIQIVQTIICDFETFHYNILPSFNLFGIFNFETELNQNTKRFLVKMKTILWKHQFMLHIFKGNISYNKFVHRLRSKPWTNKSKNLGGFLLFFTSYPNSNLNIIEYSRTSKVACICTLSAFYHMARKHSKGVSTQATNETTV